MPRHRYVALMGCRYELQAEHQRVFSRVPIVSGPSPDHDESATQVQPTRRRVGFANLQVQRTYAHRNGVRYGHIEEPPSDAASPALGRDGQIRNVTLVAGDPR